MAFATPILITGGAGFIGAQLANALASAGCSVRVLDNFHPQVHGDTPLLGRLDGRIEVVMGDVTSRETLYRALCGIERVVHLAAETGTAQSMYRIAHYHAVNCQATALLLDILSESRHRVKQLVLASSRAVYGEGCYATAVGQTVYPPPRNLAALERGRWEPADEQGRPLLPLPTPEGAPLRPASIYALTKWSQEELVKLACPASGIAYTILRLQNVYGEGQSLRNAYSGLLSVFANRIRWGKPLLLFEDGLMCRDFVHVDDVVRAFTLVLTSQNAHNQIFNVGSGVAVPLRSVAEELCLAFAQSVSIEITGQYRRGDVRHCCADLSAIGRVLGFEAMIRLEEGLRRFAQWVLSQPQSDDTLDIANQELHRRGLLCAPQKSAPKLDP
ncbi:MAG: NAD-dependent epimerase/dehydratase family protein [Aphanocapsa lilacina HA4352-LM1]|jgi:dTDP-L-rhamnose 4-epimerase|nr:NAD-dependent epimerase/dehydratase family protein [Aphanocapsa lilacina HA4352-LM1]